MATSQNVSYVQPVSKGCLRQSGLDPLCSEDDSLRQRAVAVLAQLVGHARRQVDLIPLANFAGCGQRRATPAALLGLHFLTSTIRKSSFVRRPLDIFTRRRMRASARAFVLWRPQSPSTPFRSTRYSFLLSMGINIHRYSGMSTISVYINNLIDSGSQSRVWKQ